MQATHPTHPLIASLRYPTPTPTLCIKCNKRNGSNPDCRRCEKWSFEHQETNIRILFGQRLRKLRDARNLTQAQMAKDFGIDRAYISDLERGRKTASLPMLQVIALGLQITLSELFKGL
jgi:DNA-binding XRE family transcriptional regulator